MLSTIYEEDFLGLSYGFRPGRGAHDALDALCVGIHGKKVSFILDADIRSFFPGEEDDVEGRIHAHGFMPAASPKALKAISRAIRRWTLHHHRTSPCSN